MTPPPRSERQLRALAEFRDAFNLRADMEFIPIAPDLMDRDLKPAVLVEVQRGQYPFVDLVLTNPREAS